MLQFLAGFALGAWAVTWYHKSKGVESIEHRMAEVQVRLNTLVGEARRVVDEARKGVEDRLPGGEPRPKKRPQKNRWQKNLHPRSSLVRKNLAPQQPTSR